MILASFAAAAAAFDSGSSGYVLVRWIWFLSLIAMIGAAAFRFLILARIPHHPEVHPHAGILSARVGARAAAWGLIAAALRFAAQAWAVFGAISRDATVLLQTQWGRGWILHTAATFLAWIGFRRAARGRSGWGLAALAALAAAAAPAFSGHAIAADRQPWTVIADTLHVLAAGVWIGALFVLVAAAFPAVRAAHETRRDSLLADVTHAFSPIALTAAAILLASGSWTAWLSLPSPGALLSSWWGRTLLLKLAVLSITASFGAWNWRRVRPVLGTPEATFRLRRSARSELFFAALVVLVTAVLVGLSPPGT